MKALLRFALAIILLGGAMTSWAADVEFKDDFLGKLGPGWTWIREAPEFWRTSERGLEVRVLPGNMWGGANNAKNVLTRRAPDAKVGTVEASVQLENRPTEQYEQANLVWYYSDSSMVKLGQELVDGQLSIVMGREENDQARTIAIIPLDSFSVRLRFLVTGSQIRGEFKTPKSDTWLLAGSCDLPAPKNPQPMVSLQFYQGPANVEHWARASDFRMCVLPD